MKLKIFTLGLIILLLTGCTSYTELNDLSIVNSLGIDYKNNNYNLSVSVIEGKIDDQDIEKSITIYHSSKPTLEEAFQDIYLTSNKKLYLSHIDLLILSKEAINNKLKDIINNFLDNNEYRNNFNVVVLRDEEIQTFFDENLLAEDINNLLKANEKETSMTKSKDFETIMKELLIDKNTYLPTISYKDNKISVSGFTLIKSFKYYQELTITESIILNILNNHTNKTYINNTNILENQTEIKTNKNSIDITLNIKTYQESNNFKDNLKKDIYNLITKYQNNNYDILKLTEIVKRNNYNYFKNTNNLLKDLTFNINIKTKAKNKYIQGDEFNE